MKKQPAYVNYFFRGGYVELGKTIKTAFSKCKEDIVKSWYLLCDTASDLGYLKSIIEIILVIFTFGNSGRFAIGDFFRGIWTLIKFFFALLKLISVTVCTTFISMILSVGHSVILFAFLLLAYIFFLIVLLADTLFCNIKKIATNCPNCQAKYALPTYVCVCGREHSSLKPSKYGILTRKCLCGAKLRTTFFNGRQKMPGKWICPKCEYDLHGSTMHSDVTLLVVGGPSSGKTCYVHTVISQLELNANSKYNLNFEYKPNDDLGDDYEENKDNLKNGVLPFKTNDTRLKFYQFYLTPKKNKVKNLVSLCDVAGETYGSVKEMGNQIGFKNAGGFIVTIDPLTILSYKEEVNNSLDLKGYAASEKPMDEVLTMLIGTLENMGCVKPKESIKTKVAIVFTKCDIPGIDELIGEKAVEAYLNTNPKVKSKYEAQNAVCEAFLVKYDEVNLLNNLKSKFKNLQFFTCSALGHSVDGSVFTPNGVEEPVLWLLNNQK